MPPSGSLIYCSETEFYLKGKLEKFLIGRNWLGVMYTDIPEAKFISRITIMNK